MFTPPPSPQPARMSSDSTLVSPGPLSTERQERYASTQAYKQYIGRRFRMAVILIPLLVILITARLSYVASRVVEKPAEPIVPLSWHAREENSNWRHHKRHPEPQTQASTLGSSPSPTSTSTSATPSPTATPPSSQPLPTIPSSPPAIPTPFPAPFDGGIAQNFSSLSCNNFFSNMTISAPFRQCRPFSMLLQDSNTFIDAQGNLTLLNSIIWGTCNTTPGLSQCEANIGWFAEAIKSACSDELKNNNAMASSTLTALEAFSVMYDVACQADPTSNAYCYIQAAKNANPADLYYYALPLGIAVPNSTQPTCSQCSKSVMGVYAAALEDPSQKARLTGLAQTYDMTAQLTVAQCGGGFAQTSVVSAASISFGRPTWIITAAMGVITLLLMGFPS